MGTGTKEQINESGNGYSGISEEWGSGIISENTRGEYSEQSSSEQSNSTGESNKGKRGRPKGSTNKPKSTVILQQEEAKEYQKDVNRFKKKASKGNSSVSEKMYSNEEANSTTEFIIGFIDSIGSGLLGDDGKLNMVESSLIAMSLPKYLTSIKKETVENATNVLAPILMLTGLSLYGMRVGSEILERRKQNKNVDRVRESMKGSEEVSEENTVNKYDNVETNIVEDIKEDIWAKHLDLNGNIKQPI